MPKTVRSVVLSKQPKTPTVYAASVFYRQRVSSANKTIQEQQGATTTSLAQAINWLLQQPIGVMNVSLTGPANPLLALALNQASAKNIVIVAAAGNNGPASAPLYPAAYNNVIAVTATDQHHQIYRWAVQGEHIDIAAPGVKIKVANDQGGYRYDSGTSFAAPFVSTFLSCQLSSRAQTTEFNATMDTETLFKTFSLDLGLTGKDRVFGWGELLFDGATY